MKVRCDLCLRIVGDTQRRHTLKLGGRHLIHCDRKTCRANAGAWLRNILKEAAQRVLGRPATEAAA